MAKNRRPIRTIDLNGNVKIDTSAMPRDVPEGGLKRSLELYYCERVDRARAKGEPIPPEELKMMAELYDNGILIGARAQEDFGGDDAPESDSGDGSVLKFDSPYVRRTNRGCDDGTSRAEATGT